MRISAKGHYAIAALMHISSKSDLGEPVPIVGISEALGVSKLFLEQIAAELKKGGLITAVKGARGGYRLARDPSDITALDVLKAVENTLFDAVPSEPLEQVPIISDTLSALVFAPLDKAIERCLSGITLSDLMDYKQSHGSSQSYMQYI